MNLIGVGKCEFWLVVAKLLWGGDAQLVQGWLQLLKISSQSLHCTVLQLSVGIVVAYISFIYSCCFNISHLD